MQNFLRIVCDVRVEVFKDFAKVLQWRTLRTVDIAVYL